MSIETSLFLAFLLLLGNAFFVGSEFALVSVRRSAVELHVAAGSRRAAVTLRALGNVSFLMAGAQLGITLCSLGLGAIGEPVIAHLLEAPFHSLQVSESLLHPVSFALALTIMTFLHVVIGEMIPKNIALAGPERAALLLTPMLVFIVKTLNPIVTFLNAAANLTLRLFGIQTKNEVTSTYTRDEVAELVEESHRGGLLSEDKEQLLSGAIQFDRGTVQSALIPVQHVVFVQGPVTSAEIEQLTATTGYSRFPIKKKDVVTGYVHLKDLLETDRGQRQKPIDPANIRPLISVYANESLRSVLKKMQHSGTHIATVTNRRKKLLGIVTLEDVLEELIGEAGLPPVKLAP
jgi:CBS domain containing-hemolysin-like protein